MSALHTPHTPQHVIIVGAGVIGMGIGWQLARHGVQVTLLDRGAAGAGASSAAAGMLAPTAEVKFEEHGLIALNRQSLDLYRDFTAEVESASGLSIDYRAQGTLVVGLDRDDVEALDRMLAFQHSLGMEAARLSGDQAREIEPSLSPNVHGAVWCPGDHQVDPRALVRALRAALTHAGAELREHATVARLATEGAQIRGVVVESGELVEGDCVLLATGAWTSPKRLGQGLERGAIPSIRPVRGQMIALQMEARAPLCEHVVRAPDAYLVPKSDGRLIVGATMEERGFDDRMTAGGMFELLRGAWEAMPGVYDLFVAETWVGHRPMSLSNEPIMGPSPHIDGLWCATGHGRNGILLTPLTAYAMSQSILRGCATDPIAHLAPRG